MKSAESSTAFDCTESLPLDCGTADLLRSFDRLRVAAATAATGRSGAFAGFDQLTFHRSAAASNPADEVGNAVCSARTSGVGDTGVAAGSGLIVASVKVIHRAGRSQTLAFSAVRMGMEGDGDASFHVVAEGIGRTVALPVVALPVADLLDPDCDSFTERAASDPLE